MQFNWTTFKYATVSDIHGFDLTTFIFLYTIDDERHENIQLLVNVKGTYVSLWYFIVIHQTIVQLF